MTRRPYGRMPVAAALLALPVLLAVPPAAATPEAVVGPACTQGATTGVDINSFFFSSASVAVDLGDVVEWTNVATNVQHTTTEDYVGDATAGKFVTKLVDVPLWDSGPLATSGGTFSVQFCQTGTFEYHCDIHSFMRGDVTVV